MISRTFASGVTIIHRDRSGQRAYSTPTPVNIVAMMSLFNGMFTTYCLDLGSGDRLDVLRWLVVGSTAEDTESIRPSC